jgi:ribosomal protein L11 methylase PrmA
MPPSRAPIDNIREAVFMPMAVRAALQLDVFTPLAKGALTAQELANELGVQPRRLALLLYQLVHSDFLELSDGKFTNTEMSAYYLVKGIPTYIGGVHGVWTEQLGALMQTAESIRTDKGQTKIDFSSLSPEALGGFIRGLHGMSLGTGHNLAKQPLFSEARNLIDVGGGSGGLAIALCQEHPQLHATIIDLPSVIPITVELVEDAGLSDRITVQTADILSKPLEGEFDVATARALFQVLSADQCAVAARNISAAVVPGGTLFVIGFITDDSRVAPVMSVGMNVVFISMFDDGEAYAESDYRGWLSDAGFTGISREPYLMGNSLITAQKL